jgi:hypothetical protein
VPDHLTEEQLDQYRRGTVEPTELLRLDDHLTACAECRARLEDIEGARNLARWSVGLTRYQQTDVETIAPPQVVRTIAQSITTPPITTPPITTPPANAPRRSRKHLIWIPAMAAAVLILFFARRTSGPNVEPLIAYVQDAGTTIGLDAAGVFHGPSTLDEADKNLLIDAFKSKSLPLAALPSDLVTAPGTLLGTSTPDEFSPVAPLSVTLYTDRPEFQWQPLKGAITYEIQIFDNEFHEVDSSGTIKETKWTPVMPLTRGALYQWQVIANKKDGTERTPTPPSADAKFRVLDTRTFDRVEAARKDNNHLLAAALLAKASMKDEALKELDALSAENPNSDLVRQLSSALK